MGRPFRQLTLDQFSQLLKMFPFRRQIDVVHMHHTWRPNRSMYNGLATIEAMYQFHTRENGWSDIAQHISIAPDGTIWTGRDWNDPPASAKGFNGNSMHGPFMFEMIGDFDVGKDPWDDPQKDTAIKVIALVQERFGLPVEALRLHNQMTNQKTCPGTGIKRDTVIEAVREAREALPKQPAAPAEEEEETARSFVFTRSAQVRDEELLAEPGDDGMSAAELRYYSGDEAYVQAPPGGRAFQAREFSAQELAMLRPYVVSMRQGRWDTSGIFNSTIADVDALFFEYAEKALQALPADKKLKFVIYAHGGLVSESHGLEQAQTHIHWWNQSAKEGIYPLYFIWKTGLGETLGQLLGFGSRAVREMGAAREAFTDPVVAGIVRRLGGEAVWSAMKRDAELAVEPGGVAAHVAAQMSKFCQQHQGRVELHAVGHSAGSVFHSHYIPLSTESQNPYFKTTSFMAPAATIETFLNNLTTIQANTKVLKPEVGKLTIFTMKKDYEKQDDCKGIYHQSLLYLIYHALEPADKTPLLGLEECIRADVNVVKILGLGGAAQTPNEVVWSKSYAGSGRSATQAIHHGDFSSDAPTLNSILRRVLGLNDTDPIQEFPGAPRGLTDVWDVWALPDDLPGFIPLEEPAQPATTAPAPSPTPSPIFVPGPRSGRRVSLCVGIDGYASPNRLNGCVNDARSWSQTLSQSGFEPKLLLDSDATHDGILNVLSSMVRGSKAGDVLVFQYSGHGTTVPDDTGRTVDGVEEAMVPVDFNANNPQLLMDFELAAIFNTLPAGVNLTCFIDCCHSGTITRLLVGLASQLPPQGRDERPRFITLRPEEVEAVQRYRRTFAAARGNTIGGPALMRDVVFSACRPDEVAWEANGQGDFTRLATQTLRNGFQGITNEQFATQVIQAFGSTPRQHPILDCAPKSKSLNLLQPVM
jgi:hypothetical protein